MTEQPMAFLETKGTHRVYHRNDLTGQRFGRMIALAPISRKGRATTWELLCDCGNKTTASSIALCSGSINQRKRSCGCLRVDVQRALRLRHGHTAADKISRTYQSWLTAKTSCFNPRGKGYPNVGGRGLSMEKAWAEDFAVFLADMGTCPDGDGLSRVNPMRDFVRSNVEWAPMSVVRSRASQVRWN